VSANPVWTTVLESRPSFRGVATTHRTRSKAVTRPRVVGKAIVEMERE